MAESKIPDMENFISEDVDFPDIITLKPGEEPVKEEVIDEDEGKVILTKEEFENLKKGTDSTGALLEGFKGLQEALKAPSAPANIQQQIGETDAEFEERLERELFSPGATGKTIKEAIARYGGGQVNQLMGFMSQQAKTILELHPEKGKIFNKYKGEIEDFVKALPVSDQINPQVWNYALDQITNKHKDEIIQESVNEQVDRAVAAKLKELGIDTETSTEKGVAINKPSKPAYMETGKGSGGQTRTKRTVYATPEDIEAARKSCVPIEHYLRKIGKL